jgi:hypothetical protein
MSVYLYMALYKTLYKTLYKALYKALLKLYIRLCLKLTPYCKAVLIVQPLQYNGGIGFIKQIYIN